MPRFQDPNRHPHPRCAPRHPHHNPPTSLPPPTSEAWPFPRRRSSETLAQAARCPPPENHTPSWKPPPRCGCAKALRRVKSPRSRRRLAALPNRTFLVSWGDHQDRPYRPTFSSAAGIPCLKQMQNMYLHPKIQQFAQFSANNLPAPSTAICESFQYQY